jgi:hypothetical protein
VSDSRERGSVTIVAAGAIVIVLVCTMGVADVGRGLPAAQDLALDAGDPAVDAASYAARNDAELVSCSCEAGSFEAVVEVRRTFDGLLLLPGTHSITARARAVVDLP